ncbi:trypsin-like serine protease [Basidiobolus meristosporus CBS 931.73]|uniref:Trypsin-like serine protease n=1 Tax=Basidiobolus meristosporus CBS 931.73 TaxID=1314790 RepID=A0A1Y1XZL7_9FUNG|nr:trypsin-like serine protease [Basidiobolus meristosporus CBS 931.73]|eukprot:ORX91182.1 trypsin-like serine protease [Basidiobolus meristosporus CBS 931.73]
MAASPEVVMIHLHRHNRTRSVNDEHGYVIGVRAINIHPEWDRRRLINDYAVLKLSKLAPYGSPILLDDGQASSPGALVRTLGWGRSSEQRTVDTLQQANLQVFTNKKCEAYLGGFDSRVELCAGTDAGDENICFGDSGGPLFQINDQGLPVLVGVTSFTQNCEPGLPSGFAKVSARKAWIEGFMVPPSFNTRAEPREEDSRSGGLPLFK